MIKLLLWSKLILWSCFKYQNTPTKTGDFYLLPDEQGWQDTIHFKEEGHRCSILKSFVSVFICREIHSEFSMSGLREVATPDPWNTSFRITILQSSMGQVNGLVHTWLSNEYLVVTIYILWYILIPLSYLAIKWIPGYHYLYFMIYYNTHIIPGYQMISLEIWEDIWRSKCWSSCWVGKEQTSHQDSSGQEHYDR